MARTGQVAHMTRSAHSHDPTSSPALSDVARPSCPPGPNRSRRPPTESDPVGPNQLHGPNRPSYPHGQFGALTRPNQVASTIRPSPAQLPARAEPFQEVADKIGPSRAHNLPHRLNRPSYPHDQFGPLTRPNQLASTILPGPAQPPARVDPLQVPARRIGPGRAQSASWPA